MIVRYLRTGPFVAQQYLKFSVLPFLIMYESSTFVFSSAFPVTEKNDKKPVECEHAGRNYSWANH